MATSISESIKTILDKMGVSEDQWNSFRSAIAKIESQSSGGYKARGGSGFDYDGKYQLGRVAKNEAITRLNKLKIPVPESLKKHESFYDDTEDSSRSDYRNSPETQELAFAAFTLSNHESLIGSTKYTNHNVAEKLSVLGIAHNQGANKTKRWLKDPNKSIEDGFGTDARKYSDAVMKAYPDTPVFSRRRFVPARDTELYTGTEEGFVLDRKAQEAEVETTKKVQSKLNASGYNAGPVDGFWGKKTKTAIESYQNKKGLKVTGKLNKELLSRLGIGKGNSFLEQMRKNVGMEEYIRPTTPTNFSPGGGGYRGPARNTRSMSRNTGNRETHTMANNEENSTFPSHYYTEEELKLLRQKVLNEQKMRQVKAALLDQTTLTRQRKREEAVENPPRIGDQVEQLDKILADRPPREVPTDLPWDKRDSTMWGSLGGMAVGTATSPISGPTGPLLGSIGGAAIGSAAHSAMQGVADAAGFIDMDKIPRSDEIALEALEAARTEALWGFGFVAGGHLLWKGTGLVLGLGTKDVGRIMKEADAVGLSLGASEVVESGFLAGTQKVLGIFPWIGGPSRAAHAKKMEKVRGAFDGVLNALAPNGVLSNELSIDMLRAAKNVREQFIKIAGENYNRLRGIASQFDDPRIIPTDIIKNGFTNAEGVYTPGAKQVAKALRDKIIPLEKKATTSTSRQQFKGTHTPSDMRTISKPTPDPKKLPHPSSAREAFETWVNYLNRIKGDITVDQYKGLSEKLEDFVRAATVEKIQIREVAQIRQAMELAFANPNFSKVSESQAELIKKYQLTRADADKFYANIAMFQTPVAKRWYRVDKNVFDPGIEDLGTLDADEIARITVNLKSKQSIKDLRTLLNDPRSDHLMGQALKLHVEKSFNETIKRSRSGEIQSVNWDVLKKKLGMNGSTAVNPEAMKEFFKGSGVSYTRLRQLITTAEKIQEPGSVHQFVGRRAALGGIQVALAAAGGYGVLSMGVLANIGVVLLLRHFNKIISSPHHLEFMTRTLDKTLPVDVRRMAFGTLFNRMLAEEQSDYTKDAMTSAKQGAGAAWDVYSGTEYTPSTGVQRVLDKINSNK